MKSRSTVPSASTPFGVLTDLFVLLAALFLLAPAPSPRGNAQTGSNRGIALPGRRTLQEQEVVPSDGTTGTYFGRSAAINGSTALIGAIGDNGFQGAAYLFTEANGIWSEGQKLTASDGQPGDWLGNDVALADDTLVVAASYAAVGGVFRQGAVYVFRKAGDTWVESQKLTANDSGMSDTFGSAVRLSGNTLVVGASNAPINGHDNQGAAYVFLETNGIWTQVQKLTSDDGATFDNFGAAVTVQGSTILVGAPVKVVDQVTRVTGEAYVFSQSNGSWNQIQSITEPDSGFLAGFAASLALDRGTALIGAPGATVNGHQYQGATYVFALANGMLTQTQMITSIDAASNDQFGSSVALSGTVALVSAPWAAVKRNFAQGKAYPFRNVGGNWSQAGRIISSDGAANDLFGRAVALEKGTSLVGAQDHSSNEGAVYFYAPPVGDLP